MNTLLKTFFTGLLAFLPVFLTVYAVYAFGAWINRLSNDFLQWIAPGLPNLPGLGIALGFIAIFMLGVLVSSRLTRWIYQLVEVPLRRLPIVKDLYIALKQLLALLAPDDKASGQVVSLKHPDHPVALIGVMMDRDPRVLPPEQFAGGVVAVYLPFSYQIGGYTLFVPPTWITPLDMTVEAAMRAALTGWMHSDSRRPPDSKSIAS